VEAPQPTPRRRRSLRYGADDFLASRGARFAAWLLDGIVQTVAAISLFLVPGFIDVMLDEEPATDFALGSILLALLLPLGFWIFQMYLLTRDGQTLGKKILGIRVVDHQAGTNPGFARVVLMRTVLPGVIDACVKIFWLIDGLFIFGAEKRCVHDHMAGTKVVRKDAPMVDPRVFD